MEIRGPNSTNRPDLHRADDSRKAGRLGQNPGRGSADDQNSEGDSLDVSASRLIEESVDKVLGLLERRATEVRDRREELLGLADDPAAVSSAARGILAGDNLAGIDEV